MANGIFEKVGTLLSANVHALLDSVLNLNKMAVFDETVRKLREAREEIIAAEGDARGRLRTLEREISEVTQEQAKRDQDIDRLLARADAVSTDEATKRECETAARSLQAVYNERNGVLASKQQLLQSVQLEVPRLAQSRVAVEARIQMLEAQRSKLEALISARKAAEAQGKALSKIDIYREFSADDMTRDEQAALDRAQGRLEARQATMDSAVDRLLGSEELDQQLAERRARRTAGSA